MRHIGPEPPPSASPNTRTQAPNVTAGAAAGPASCWNAKAVTPSVSTQEELEPELAASKQGCCRMSFATESARWIRMEQIGRGYRTAHAHCSRRWRPHFMLMQGLTVMQRSNATDSVAIHQARAYSVQS